MNQPQEHSHKIFLVDIKLIKIVNPRTRNKFTHNEIKENIERTGLRKPITLRRINDRDYEYALICGQGRLEALINLGETKVPAIIKKVGEEDGYIMSLAENIARRNPRSAELFEIIRNMKKDGLTDKEIGDLIGCSTNWVNNITMLIDKGEQKLLSAVENQKIPLYLAVEFAKSDTKDSQLLFLDAYEKGLIKSRDVVKIRNILDQRSEGKKGSRGIEYIQHKGKKKISPEELMALYQDSIDKHKAIHTKSEYVAENLILTKQIMQELILQQEFTKILLAENISNIPTLIIESTQK